MILNVDFEGGWQTVWSAIQSQMGAGLSNLLTAIGVILVVAGLVTWFWQRRRGGGGSSSGLAWTIAVGALFAAPGALIPILLRIIDWITNAVINIIG